MLHKLNRILKLGGDPNEADLTWKFNNHSVIRLGGAATAAEIGRFRGYAVKLAYVDECQRFSHYLKSLVDDVLIPGCIDMKGDIRLIGTPPPVPVGYFYEMSLLPNNHYWTMFDNPWIEDAQGELDRELARRGVTIDDPTIQREFFGKFTIDQSSLVLHYSKDINDYDEVPVGIHSFIMGIDIGFKDADAIAILGHGSSSPTIYLIEELVTPKQGLSELFTQVEGLRKKYNCYKLVIDTGGLGLKIAEEMRRRWRIPVYAAEKQRKFENLEILNDALRTQRFKARTTSRFSNDSMLLEWDMDKLRPDKRVISDRFHSDIVDATLYAFRESPAYSYQEPIKVPKYGSPEWAKAEEEEMEKQAYESALRFEEENKQDEEFLNWI